LTPNRQNRTSAKATVGELRENAALAWFVGFKDDPRLREDATILHTKPVGWLPTREFFFLLMKHGSALRAAVDSNEDGLTEFNAEFERLLKPFIPD
jgi:hypothetical protein